MSLETILQDLAADQFGPTASLHFEFPGRRVVAWITRNPGDGGDEVVAIAASKGRPEAMRLLLQMLSRNDCTLSTEEVTAVLGIDQSRVWRYMAAGRLASVQEGTRGPGGSARFAPAEVWRFWQLPRRRGQREPTPTLAIPSNREHL